MGVRSTFFDERFWGRGWNDPALKLEERSFLSVQEQGSFRAVSLGKGFNKIFGYTGILYNVGFIRLLYALSGCV